MRKIAILIKTILMFFAIGVSLNAQDLSWEIIFSRGIQQESVPISRQIRMETGEQFQISILSDSNSFCYLVHYGSSREIAVLFNSQIRGGNEVNIGPFQLINPSGIETIYVIMSLERQTELERLIQAYNNNPNSRRHANNLLREVARLQTAASELGEPASAFIASGGTTRTAVSTESNTIQNRVTRFSEKVLYVRAITIRH